jgi:short-subunit dehydrogenase
MNQTSSRPFAIITGASSGIGYELAVQFAEHDFDLMIASGSSAINDAAARLRDHGVSVQSVEADLASSEGVEKLYREIRTAGRPVDALVLNAGVGVSGDFVRDTDWNEELNLINLNVISPVHLAKLVLPDMVGRGRGRVLITSSIAGVMPAPFDAVYGASKAFLKSFAEAIRNELKDTGVTVTTLMPGATETNFFQRAGMEDTKVGAGKKDDPREVARQGYEALMAGEDHIVAGSFMNKVQATASHVLPDTVTAEIHRGMSQPGSAEKK